MEPVSFAISVAGLAVLYSNCVACFSAFKNCQSFERDHKILATKLDVGKTILLQWGERVGLMDGRKSDVDPRLYDKHTKAAITQVLECVEVLLTNTEKLERVYGLRPDRSGSNLARADILSSHRMRKFEKLQPGYDGRASHIQRRVNVVAKMRWAIGDRNKFGKLVDEIRGFVSSLDRLIRASQKTRLRLREEDLDALGSDVQKLRLVEEATAIHHMDWSDAVSDRATASETASSVIGSSRPKIVPFRTVTDVAVDVNEWQEKIVTEIAAVPETTAKLLGACKAVDHQSERLARPRSTYRTLQNVKEDSDCTCKAILTLRGIFTRWESLCSRAQALNTRSYQPLSKGHFCEFAMAFFKLKLLYLKIMTDLLRLEIRFPELKECHTHPRNRVGVTEEELNEETMETCTFRLFGLDEFVGDHVAFLPGYVDLEYDIGFSETFVNTLEAHEECLLLMSFTVRRGGVAQQAILKELGEITEFRLWFCSTFHLAHIKSEIDNDVRTVANECKLLQDDGFQTAIETCALKDSCYVQGLNGTSLERWITQCFPHK